MLLDGPLLDLQAHGPAGSRGALTCEGARAVDACVPLGGGAGLDAFHFPAPELLRHLRRLLDRPLGRVDLRLNSLLLCAQLIEVLEDYAKELPAKATLGLQKRIEMESLLD